MTKCKACRRRTQMRAVLSTEPVAKMQSLYLFQSQLKISYLPQDKH